MEIGTGGTRAPGSVRELLALLPWPHLWQWRGHALHKDLWMEKDLPRQSDTSHEGDHWFLPAVREMPDESQVIYAGTPSILSYSL